jgi:hypothetical protein
VLQRSGKVAAAAVAAAQPLIASRMIARRLLAMFFPTPFVRFPFVLEDAPPVANHRVRRILSAIVAVIIQHARGSFNFRAARSIEGACPKIRGPSEGVSQIVDWFVTTRDRCVFGQASGPALRAPRARGARVSAPMDEPASESSGTRIDASRCDQHRPQAMETVGQSRTPSRGVTDVTERSVTPDDGQALPQPRRQFDHVQFDHHVHTVLASGLISRSPLMPVRNNWGVPVSTDGCTKGKSSATSDLGSVAGNQMRDRPGLAARCVCRETGARLRATRRSTDLHFALQSCRPPRVHAGTDAETGRNPQVDVGIAIALGRADLC